MLKKLFVFCLICFPCLVFAYDSVIRSPETPFEILPILNPTQSQEFFGKLDGFPHVYEFVAKQPFTFKSQVYASKRSPQKNDVSILLVKEMTRGVLEVAKTHEDEKLLKTNRDHILAETFYKGGSIEAALEPGIYKFEVSSPNNDAYYRVVMGDSTPGYSYFHNLKRLFEVKNVFDAAPFSALFSVLLSIPIGILVALYFLWRYYRKKHA